MRFGDLVTTSERVGATRSRKEKISHLAACLRGLRPDEVRGIIEHHGLETSEVTGVSFNPISGRWRLSSDSSVNYMLLAAKGA